MSVLPRAVDFLEVAWANPFDSDAARAHSSYFGYHDGALVPLLESAAPAPSVVVANATFRAFVLDERFSCLGAKSAVQRGAYRIGSYARLDDAAVTEGLARDLYAWSAERQAIDGAFSTFVAVFRARAFPTELAFEAALWSQLQRLHELDRTFHPWDARVAHDPESPDFSYSVAGNAFFVVGLHPAASRTSRRFAWPTLVFNAHQQFEQLREAGRFDGLRARIRERERRLEGTLNPNLADYGSHAEARQYSGRAVEEGWRCPFSARG